MMKFIQPTFDLKKKNQKTNIQIQNQDLNKYQNVFDYDYENNVDSSLP